MYSTILAAEFKKGYSYRRAHTAEILPFSGSLRIGRFKCSGTCEPGILPGVFFDVLQALSRFTIGMPACLQKERERERERERARERERGSESETVRSSLEEYCAALY